MEDGNVAAMRIAEQFCFSRQEFGKCDSNGQCHSYLAKAFEDFARRHPDCSQDDCPCVRRGIDLMAKSMRQR